MPEPGEKEALMKHSVCIQLQISQCGFFFPFFESFESDVAVVVLSARVNLVCVCERACVCGGGGGEN